jgi:hypothetical protein
MPSVYIALLVRANPQISINSTNPSPIADVYSSIFHECFFSIYRFAIDFGINTPLSGEYSMFHTTSLAESAIRLYF